MKDTEYTTSGSNKEEDVNSRPRMLLRFCERYHAYAFREVKKTLHQHLTFPLFVEFLGRKEAMGVVAHGTQFCQKVMKILMHWNPSLRSKNKIDH